MKKTLLTLSLGIMVMFTTPSFAEEGKFSAGLGTYGMTLTLSAPSAKQNVLFYGTSLVLNYDFTKNIAVRGHVYSMDEQLFFTGTGNLAADYTNKGYDLSARYGKNDLGFTYFGALGFYKESIEATTLSALSLLRPTDASGAIYGVGIGYNWKYAAFTIEGYARSAGDYKTGLVTDATAVTSSINLSFRF